MKQNIYQILDEIEKEGSVLKASYSLNMPLSTLYYKINEWVDDSGIDTKTIRTLMLYKIMRLLLEKDLNSNDFLKISKALTLGEDNETGNSDLSSIINKIEKL